MKTVVTGAAGFIGSTLTRRLLDDGHNVVGIDSLDDYYDVALKRRNLVPLKSPRFRLVEEDLNTAELASLIDGAEVVFHLAGQPGVRQSWGVGFDPYVRQNIAATQRLLETAKDSPSLRRFVFASSSSVYGDAERYPVTESDLPRPASPYGVTKLAAEHLCRLYATTFGVPTVALRFFTVYGPRQRPDMAFARFVKAAVLDEPVAIYGDGTQERDFTYVDDIVAANLIAAESDLPAGSVFNVAGGASATVREALGILEELAGTRLSVSYGDLAAGDVFRTGGSTKALHDATNWTPTVSLDEGLRRHLAWAREFYAGS